MSFQEFDIIQTACYLIEFESRDTVANVKNLKVLSLIRMDLFF